MITIAVLSDTHLSTTHESISLWINRIEQVDYIIHAGDFVGLEVIPVLERAAILIAVRGNNDAACFDDLLPLKKKVVIEDYHIGICHGHGSGKNTLERAYTAFCNEKVDIIIYGHSHQPSICTKNKILMLNPGSPFYKRKERWFSYIVLKLSTQGISAELRLTEKAELPTR
ncbi:metallophosphoesterase family protein [Dendrosporobacter sp. 1207_IL3150]|uniref:metallophosphoesterase family protein n=1 Tax=Dendrosporobacter sp. 1207_IL3150 TaxID=3084054 RepID=UPI002FD9A941